MSTEIYNIQLPKLSNPQHKEKTFKLVSVMNTILGNETRAYRLLFKDMGSSMYTIDNLPPELLFNFTVGSYYKDSYKTNDKPDGDEKTIEISGSHYIVGKIGDYIQDDEFDFNHQIESDGKVTDFSNEIKNQYCIVYKFQGEMVIVPSYLIGEKFFFVSTNMRRRIFDSQPEKLYEKIEYEGNKPIVYLKPGVAFADASYLAHNHQHAYGLQSWEAIRNNLNKEQYKYTGNIWHVPLKITLPFKNKIQMHVRYQQLPNNKILVYEIIDHERFFSFSNIEIVTSGNEGEEDNTPRYVVPKKNRGKKKQLTNKKPSKKNTYAGIKNKVVEDRLKFSGVVIEHRIENKNDNPKIPTLVENSNETTNVSSASPVAGGDEGTSHLNANKANKEEDKKQKKAVKKCTVPFVREHFKQIFTVILNDKKVKNAQLFTNKLYPIRIGIEQCNLKESYDKTCPNRRKWDYFRFTYENKYICVIDLDQAGLVHGSSIFVLKSPQPIIENDIEELLRDYAKGKKIDAIKSKLLSRAITLIPRRHKCPNSKDSQKIWSLSLLKSLKDKPV